MNVAPAFSTGLSYHSANRRSSARLASISAGVAWSACRLRMVAAS